MNKNDLQVAQAMTHLEDIGIIKVIVRYSGSGDSGAIDEILYEKIDEEDISATDAGVNDDVHASIEQMSYNLLNDVEDWYNNDGGFGTIIIHIPSGSYEIENNINIMQVETYNHEGNLTD